MIYLAEVDLELVPEDLADAQLGGDGAEERHDPEVGVVLVEELEGVALALLGGRVVEGHAHAEVVEDGVEAGVLVNDVAVKPDLALHLFLKNRKQEK